MKIPIFPGKYHQNGGFSWAMLVYRRVVLFLSKFKLSRFFCWQCEKPWWRFVTFTRLLSLKQNRVLNTSTIFCVRFCGYQWEFPFSLDSTHATLPLSFDMKPDLLLHLLLINFQTNPNANARFEIPSTQKNNHNRSQATGRVCFSVLLSRIFMKAEGLKKIVINLNFLGIFVRRFPY